jgi:hypothetical protein
MINQRLYKGNLDSPKGRKGKRTNRVVALSLEQRWTSRNGVVAWASVPRMLFCFLLTIFVRRCVGTILGTGACGRSCSPSVWNGQRSRFFGGPTESGPEGAHR